jgi:hypothetical protein
MLIAPCVGYARRPFNLIGEITSLGGISEKSFVRQDISCAELPLNLPDAVGAARVLAPFIQARHRLPAAFAGHDNDTNSSWAFPGRTDFLLKYPRQIDVRNRFLGHLPLVWPSWMTVRFPLFRWLQSGRHTP